MQKLGKLHNSLGVLGNEQYLTRQVQGFKQRSLHRCDFTGGKGRSSLIGSFFLPFSISSMPSSVDLVPQSHRLQPA